LAQQGITPTLDDKGAVTGFTQKGDAKEGLDGKTTAPTIDAIAPLQAKIDELQKRVDLFTGMIQQGGTAGDDNTLPINYTPADMAELRKNLDDSEGQLASFSTLLNQIKQAGQNLPVYGKVAPDANKGIADQEKTLSEQQAKIAQLKVELDQKQQPLENARIETSQNRQEQSLDADTTNQKAAEKTHEDVAKHMRDLTIAQDRAALEADKKLSEDGKKAGSDAETDIRLLGGSKAQIEAAHIAVQELSQGHAEGAAQLEDILNNLVWSTQSLTANQKDFFEGIIEKLQQVADNLNDHNAQIQNLKRPSL
jgi:chromosome segregation ATPase